MKRRVFAILSVMSLVLAVAVAALWARSYWVQDTIHLHIFDFCLDGRSDVGKFMLDFTEHSHRFDRVFQSFQVKPSWYLIRLNLVDFRGGWFPPETWVKGWFTIFPHWVPVLVFSVLPALWFFRRTRRRNKPACPPAAVTSV